MAKLPTKSKKLSEISSEITHAAFVSGANQKPTSGAVVVRKNFPLTQEESDLIDQFSHEAAGSKKIDVVRAGLAALTQMSIEKRTALIRESQSTAPKTGRPPVKA
ncbi:Uncharacterised protein [Yersinia aldovae]|uniref:hypothetical protein n=1 Tax=Yersinia aldovae TaxID=29483 RepID=UPI0005E477C0|nr:hypothetical protein [Yersinia aldovae]CNK26271.1 Uncharacterised protein [Yersinia aldovae]